MRRLQAVAQVEDYGRANMVAVSSASLDPSVGDISHFVPEGDLAVVRRGSGA